MNSHGARSRILARLRAAQQFSSDNTLPVSPSPSPSPSPKASLDTALPRLIEKLTNNRFEVFDARDEPLESIFNEICMNAPSHWMLGDGDFNQYLGAIIHLLSNQTVSYFNQPFEALKGTIFDSVQIGITGCEGIILDTGSVVVQPSREEPRSLSLIPPIHIVMADPRRTFGSLDDFLCGHPAAKFQSHSNLLVISSPSKTADIQQKIAYGAHGPERVIIIFSDRTELSI